MAKCCNCGKDATFLYRNEWWCAHHFRKERKKRENIEITLEENIQKLPCYGTATSDTSEPSQTTYTLEKTGLKAL